MTRDILHRLRPFVRYVREQKALDSTSPTLLHLIALIRSLCGCDLKQAKEMCDLAVIYDEFESHQEWFRSALWMREAVAKRLFGE